MFIGQIMVYRYNDLSNAEVGRQRNIYTLRDVKVETASEFKEAVQEALDEVPPGKGYALVRWNGRTFKCEKDKNNPHVDYVRHEILYHPLLSAFMK